MKVIRRILLSRRKAFIWWSVAVFLLIIVNAAAYPAIANEQSFSDLMESYPEFVQELFGLGEGLSIAEPAGYLNSQIFSNLLPLLFIIYLISFAVRETATDERDGTLDLVAAHPIPRRRLMLEKAGAMLIASVALAVVSVITVVVTAPPFELGGVGFSRLVGTTVSVFGTGVVFGGLAFALGAATGRRGLALGAASGLAVATYILFGLAPLVDSITWMQRLSPFFWALTGEPILNGLQVGNFALMLGVAAVFVAVGIWLFERRDLRV